MTLEVNALLGSSIIVAGVIVAIRFKKVNSDFTPFMILIWLGFATELISYFVVRAGNSNALVYNIYSVFEMLIIAWQFQRWKALGNNRFVYPTVVFLIFGFWIVENFILGSIHFFNSYFVIFFSYLVVINSIRMINILLAKHNGTLFKSPIFIICIAFIFYFTYSVLVELFWMYGLDKSEVFADRIYDILVYLNLFTNILYAIAALWMPKKPSFILPS